MTTPSSFIPFSIDQDNLPSQDTEKPLNLLPENQSLIFDNESIVKKSLTFLAEASPESNRMFSKQSAEKLEIEESVKASPEPNIKTNIVNAISTSLTTNDQNLTSSQLELCQQFVSSTSTIYDEIHDIIISLHITNGTFDITHVDIPLLLLSISNFVKKIFHKSGISLSTINNLPSQATEKSSKINTFDGGIAEAKNEFFETKCREMVEEEDNSISLLVLVQFVMTALINSNIIVVPPELKSSVELLIKYSIQLLEMTIPVIDIFGEDATEEKTEVLEPNSKVVKKSCSRFFYKLFSRKKSKPLVQPAVPAS
jgi:hypothetical protein